MNIKIEDFKLPVLAYLIYRSILIISTFIINGFNGLGFFYYFTGLFILCPFIIGYRSIDYNKKKNILFWLILLVIISIIFIITEPFYYIFIGTKDYMNSQIERKDYLFMKISERDVYSIYMYILDVLVYFIGNVIGYIKKIKEYKKLIKKG